MRILAVAAGLALAACGGPRPVEQAPSRPASIAVTHYGDSQFCGGFPAPKTPPSELRRACERGDARGCLSLAELYLCGTGVERDPAEADRLLQRACEGGRASACLALGVLLTDGVE